MPRSIVRTAQCTGILVGVLVGFSAVHAHEEQYHEQPQEEVVIIRMTPGGFEPTDVQVSQGDTVLFVNEDERERWPASDIHPTHGAYPGSGIEKCGTEEEGHIFDSCKGVAPGGSYRFTFTKTGEWHLHDHLYPDFTGEIMVGAKEGFVEEESADGSQTVFERLSTWLRQRFTDLFYAVFPGKLQERLSSVSIFEISNDEEALAEVLRLAGIERTMTRLLDEADGGYSIDCHQPAHQVGRVAFTVFGAETFEKGDASCHSGFYHGAMESFLAQRGTEDLSSTISQLCGAFDTTFGEFECLHGVGHGVMAYEGYDMPEALEVCSTLGDDFAQSSCYGGVFMENIVAAQGLGAIPGHQTEWVDESDPYFPCSTLEAGSSQEYQCYQMQTSLMLWYEDFDFGRVSRLCAAAPASAREACFISLGRDSAGFTLRNPARTIANCAEAPREDDLYLSCVMGGLNVVLDFWGPKLTTQGEEFCEQVAESDVRKRCFEMVELRKEQILTPKSGAVR